MINSLITGYIYGSAVKAMKSENYAKALKLFNKIKDHSAGANYHIGIMYFHGYGVRIDYLHALRDFESSFEGFYLDAGFYIGWCHERLGNTEQAIIWYKKFLDNDVKSIFRLARILIEDKEIVAEDNEIVDVLSRGVALNDASCQYLLGKFYLDQGMNVEYSKNLLQLAANQGLSRAASYLKQF